MGWETNLDSISRMDMGHLQAMVFSVTALSGKTKDVSCNVALAQENEPCVILEVSLI